MVNIYNYDEEGRFTTEQIALVNEFGKTILPENATFEKPLSPKEGFDVIFKNGWVYEKKESPKEPTEEEIKQERIEELKQYLATTDWYVSRFAETGKAIPAEVSEKRAAARIEISQLQTENEVSNESNE